MEDDRGVGVAQDLAPGRGALDPFAIAEGLELGVKPPDPVENRAVRDDVGRGRDPDLFDQVPLPGQEEEFLLEPVRRRSSCGRAV